MTAAYLWSLEEVDLVNLLDSYDFADDDLLADLGSGDDAGVDRLADALRQTLRDEYADASDEEMGDALVNVFDAMSPAESFNFASALNQIGKSAGQLLSDPTLGSIARTALPIAGGALGTMVGGPVGTALGSQLGNAAVGALLSRAPARPPAPQGIAAPPTAVPAGGTPAVTPAGTPIAAPAVASPVAGGSAAAAQGLVLTQQPQVLQGLLAAALGQHGRQQIAGVPVAQLLGMLSQVIGQAAADADELMYLGSQSDDSESLIDNSSAEPDRSLYTSLLDADNLELAEALVYEGIG